MKIKHVKRQFQKREYHVKFTRRIFMTPPSTKFRYTLYSICTALRNSGVGDGGASAPLSVDLSKSRAKFLIIWVKSLKNLGKIPKYLSKIPENLGKDGAQVSLAPTPVPCKVI